MRYRLIVWDFDGTLADTLAMAFATYNSLALQFGFLPIDDPAAVRNMGALGFFRKHGIPLYRVPLLVKAYLAATKGRMAGIRLFEGVPELLRGFKGGGSRLGVLSSNSADNIRSCLNANGVENEFDFVVGYPRLFGKATALRRLLKDENVDRRHFLYVGDEVRDVEAAKKAGVDSAAVGWGINSSELLAKQSPTFLWPSPTDVLPALLGGNSS